MTPDDLRHEWRVPRAFMVRYLLPESGKNRWSMSPMRDFHSAGARFLCDYPFAIGDTMTLQLLLPKSRQPIGVNADVVWLQAHEQLGVVEVGVEFKPTDSVVTREILDDSAKFFQERNLRKPPLQVR